MNYNKEMVIEPVFKSARPGPFHTILITTENNKTGIMNNSGEMILPTEYKIIIPENGYFKVKKEGTDWYYVNFQNEKVNCQVY